MQNCRACGSTNIMFMPYVGRFGKEVRCQCKKCGAHTPAQSDRGAAIKIWDTLNSTPYGRTLGSEHRSNDYGRIKIPTNLYFP